ncbi:hypothetical protein HAX54_049828 [Datura stramonium]|uniref:Uncharacterized protein n=1 Tax=Datura stramonium TaxID=4076 RepID=A0ABS8WMZ2_DATST|nr:hypothetical protein [Datura stramonium]
MKNLVAWLNLPLEEELTKLKISIVMEEQLNIDYYFSEHSRDLCRVGPGFEESFDYDDPTDDEKAHVDSDLESDADEGEEFEIGEVAYAPVDDEE